MESFLFVLHRNKLVLKSDWDQQDDLSLMSWRWIASKDSKIRYPLGCTGVSHHLALDAFPSQPSRPKGKALRNNPPAHKRSPFKPSCISGSPTHVLLPCLLLPSYYTPGTLPAFPSRGRARGCGGRISPGRGAQIHFLLGRRHPSPHTFPIPFLLQKEAQKDRSKGPAPQERRQSPPASAPTLGAAPLPPAPRRHSPSRSCSARLRQEPSGRRVPALPRRVPPHTHPPLSAAPSPTSPWTEAPAGHAHTLSLAEPDRLFLSRAFRGSARPLLPGAGTLWPFAPEAAASSGSEARDGAGKARGWGVKVRRVLPVLLLQRPWSSNCTTLCKTIVLKYGESLPCSPSLLIFGNCTRFPFQAHTVFFPVRLLFIKVRFHSGTRTQPLRGLDVWVVLQLCSVLASVPFDDFGTVSEWQGIDESAQVPKRIFPNRELRGTYRSLIDCITNKFENQSQGQNPILLHKSFTDCTLEGSEFSIQPTFREINSEMNVHLRGCCYKHKKKQI